MSRMLGVKAALCDTSLPRMPMTQCLPDRRGIPAPSIPFLHGYYQRGNIGMETPNMRITIEGVGDAAKVFSQVDAIREILAAQGFDVHSMRVEESASE